MLHATFSNVVCCSRCVSLKNELYSPFSSSPAHRFARRLLSGVDLNQQAEPTFKLSRRR